MLRGVTRTLTGKILREHSFVHHEPRTRGAVVPLVDDAIGPAARVTRDDCATAIIETKNLTLYEDDPFGRLYIIYPHYTI